MMKTQSAKAKGRRLQQQFRELLIEELGIHPEDIESRSMGAGGEDLIMAKAARNAPKISVTFAVIMVVSTPACWAAVIVSTTRMT